MTNRKDISDATLEELRDFAEIVCGVELDGRATAQSIIAKLRAGGYEGDQITVGLSSTPSTQPVINTHQGRVPFKTEEVTSVDVNKKKIKRTRAYFGIRIETHDGPGGEDGVPVSVNGRSLSIPRGVAVAIPEEYIEVLTNAVQLIYDPIVDIGPNNPGGLGKPRKVPSYPFSYVPNSEVEFVASPRGQQKVQTEAA